MTVLQRYLLIQVPGWVVVAVVLFGLYEWGRLPLWGAVGLYGGYVLKDFVLYPFLRRAYETGEKTGSEQMIGQSGVAVEQLAPEGYVQVRGELWHAEVVEGPAVPQGGRIRVRSARGMTLLVTKDED